MTLREHPEVQILISEIDNLLLQNENLQTLLEKTSDQLIRATIELERVIKYLEPLDEVPELGCRPQSRLAQVADIIKAVESYLDYERQE